MAKYTIQDIDIIRRKSGLSYNEAVSLLKYHNGSLTQALLDLEKNGKILEHETKVNTTRKGKHKNIFYLLYRLRLKIRKDNIVIINLSSLFLIFALLFAPWVVIVGILFALVMGYHIRIDSKSREFEDVSLEDTIKHASENIKHTVDNIIRESAKDDFDDVTEEPEVKEPRAESPASGTKPVDVELPEDGEYTIKDGDDGFHEASIS
ncbi:MAG TPA: DUF4342 domain-containing protein [Candidatus Limiplasma sp.]|nr:DUF4342 domain-containing protein [Candidatus Limiplasma sp.]HRX09308.1 DUF4342 domain-containing protein [Candidatus Limiplasma sp.]